MDQISQPSFEMTRLLTCIQIPKLETQYLTKGESHLLGLITLPYIGVLDLVFGFDGVTIVTHFNVILLPKPILEHVLELGWIDTSPGYHCSSLFTAAAAATAAASAAVVAYRAPTTMFTMRHREAKFSGLCF
ncbi:hypothetical protein F5Y09DRAFT_296843 [Xylaria sp. FL1042]|nr:hypothetical protein F5Y09DRAFT_296843 [Xylaria sp. FL1042]